MRGFHAAITLHHRKFPVPAVVFPIRSSQIPGYRATGIWPQIFDPRQYFRGWRGAVGFESKKFPVKFPVHGNLAGSVAEVLEALRRRADDGRALRRHFEHREAMLHQAVGREAEEAVNPGETVRVEDRRLRKSFAALSARQHRGERRCIVTERGEARGAMAIGGAEALRELLPRLRR